MFGLGTWEIVLILGVGLIVLGPDKLPSVARKLGRSVRDLRRAASDFSREIQREGVDESEPLIPPDGAQAHGHLEEEGEDEALATAKEEHAGASAKDTAEEPLVADPPDSPNGSETKPDTTDAGPYAELYDPRAQRTQPEDTTVASLSDPGKPPSA